MNHFEKINSFLVKGQVTSYILMYNNIKSFFKNSNIIKYGK